jgi:hypothetical protein
MPELLTTINLQLIAGVNAFVLHGTPYSGDYAGTTWPGYTPFYYVVTEMHSKCQPAWNAYKSSMDYVARNSMISQLGTAKIDLAFLTSTNAFTFPLLNTSSLASAGRFLFHLIYSDLYSFIIRVYLRTHWTHEPQSRIINYSEQSTLTQRSRIQGIGD